MEAVKLLRQHLEAFEERVHAPFSRRRDLAAVLLSDGQWAPGVRVESASYPLVIPATLNAVTTAYAAGYRDVAAVVSNRALTKTELAFFAQLESGPFRAVGDSCLLSGETDRIELDDEPLSPFLSSPAPDNAEDGIEQARDVADQAYIPESNFPVGCILVAEDGRCIPGVNVEHPDWSSILCAERNALSTAITCGVGNLSALYLSCPKIDSGTPCGACRQLLLELAPEITIWMDRGAAAPQSATPEELLPGAFSYSDSV